MSPEWFDAVALDEGRLRKPNKSASGLAFGDPQSQKAMANFGHMRKALGRWIILRSMSCCTYWEGSIVMHRSCLIRCR